MSAATAKKNGKNQPALATTGRGAVLCITLGIVLLTLGAAWLLSLLPGTGSTVLSQFLLALQGLAGPLCPFLPVLLIWIGGKMMVSARHRVAARDVLIVSALYLLVQAGYTLIARVAQSGASYISYMQFVGDQNYKTMTFNYGGFSAYLRQAYLQRAHGAGGLLGMLLAYPLWKTLGRIGGLLFIGTAIIVLLFLLFRVNPGDLFRSASDRSEQYRLRRVQKQQEKERALAAQRAAENTPAPVVQEYPMEQVNPGQTVEREETLYTAPDYYQPAPIYDTQPAVRDESGFYPVQLDLYDERFPLHNHDAQQPEPAPQWQQQTPPDAPVQLAEPFDPPESQQSAPSPQKPVRLRGLRRSRTDAPLAAADPTAPVPDAPTPIPPPLQQQTPQPVPQPARQQDAAPQEDDDLPWETQAPRPAAVTPAPAPSVPASKPAPAGDWAAQVQQKKEALDHPLPPHTIARGEAQPVYTDPVMPLTGERVPITPKKETGGTKLDGTSAPKVRQGSMGMPIAYQAPPIRLLNEARRIPQADTAHEDERRAHIIEETLRSFAVESEVKQIMHGPSITRFAIQIAPGVKVSRVSNTADNLALELKTKHVRVEAPIQGTSYIGIEVPNALVSTVSLREVLDSPEMHNNPSPLLVALGKDIAGAPILCDLGKMPHLLIAGATGSGKSVCINSIVCSLLYRTSPDQVRMIMIDPKQVELSVYNSIPHLLVPVVSDPRKAAGALAWVVQEMTERYGKFSAQNVRNLAGYNKVNQGTDQVLPNIVVIIDEMADLMEVCRKDVEESIRRLAALARAAGIYMVLATQRPSVDVITGVIKNNIPSRIAFAVSSGTDSRTIIDINGAEKLMGKGDMLYKPAGTSPVRVQGCFVSDDEVNAITEYIASRYQTDYDPNIVEHLDNAGKEHEADEITGLDDDGGATGDGLDDLLRQAIEMAVEDGQTSTSMLQRRLRVGYARAGRLIDEMEKRGVISQSEGSKPRKTLITREQYYELFRDD